MGLHGIVVLHGGGVSRCYGGAGGRPRIAALGIRRFLIDLAGRVRIPLARLEIQVRGFLMVGGPDPRRGGGRLIQGLGHDHGDGLAVVIHTVVLQERHHPSGGWIDRGTAAFRESGGVQMGHDHQHPGHARGLVHVDVRDAAPGYGAQYQHGMGHARQLDIAHVAGAAGDLQRAIDAVDPLSDQSHPEASVVPAAVMSARTNTHLPSSTLNPLWARGTASRKAAAASACAAARSSGRPTSI